MKKSIKNFLKRRYKTFEKDIRENQQSKRNDSKMYVIFIKNLFIILLNIFWNYAQLINLNYGFLKLVPKVPHIEDIYLLIDRLP